MKISGNKTKLDFEETIFQESPSDDGEGAVLVSDRSIGDLIAEECGLTPAQIEEILAYQRKHGVRFGEAAVALKLANSDDVLRALSRQYQYSYSPALLEGSDSTELVVASSPFSEEAENFRELRSQLIQGILSPQTGRKAIAVISADVGDGKTFVTSNLAVAFSQLGGRTLLIDADMRTPRIHKVFGLQSDSGLSGILSGRTGSTIQQVQELPSLYVMTVGPVPPNPLELVQRPVFSLLIKEVTEKFDYVLVDTPAGSHGADARVIAHACGAALVISRKGKSKAAAVQNLLKKLGKGPAAVAGVVLNEH